MNLINEGWGPGIDVSDHAQHVRCLGLLLHCCDISNPGKEWSIYCEWTDKVMQEFACIEYDDKLLNTFEKSFVKTEMVFKEEVKNGLLDKSVAKILARYIIGTQIKYCLEKNGSCSITCEC